MTLDTNDDRGHIAIITGSITIAVLSLGWTALVLYEVFHG